jgi:hypothetical protein
MRKFANKKEYLIGEVKQSWATRESLGFGGWIFSSFFSTFCF